MEYERVSGPSGQTELWAYQWDITVKPPVKVNRIRIGVEQPPPPAAPTYVSGAAVTWSYGRTLGDIATANPNTIAAFPSAAGRNVVVGCEIVTAGKFRNGRPRYWCRTHQKHWGVRADVADSARYGVMRCAQQSELMWYLVNPTSVALDQNAEVGVWCSMPAAMTSQGILQRRYPKIHVHVRTQVNGPKVIDQDFDALTLSFNPVPGLFGSTLIDRVHVTPPAAKEFVLSLESGKAVSCFNCRDCGAPHLDLGGFSNTPHRKHLCGNCGRDNTWTREPRISNPLKPLHDHFSGGWQYVDVDRVLNIDRDHPQAEFALWASTPAIVWTAARPQERGIHVHLVEGGQRVIDDTFGTVIYKGVELDRNRLLATMIQNTCSI
ncbi:hypothetical protein [Burkholderia glumae]